MDLKSAREAGVLLRHSSSASETGLRISYNKETGSVRVDRSQAGTSNFSGKFSPFHEVALPSPGSKVHLTILLDSSSVEVFAAGGTAVISDTFFPDWDNTGSSAFSMEGDTDFTVTTRGL